LEETQPKVLPKKKKSKKLKLKPSLGNPEIEKAINEGEDRCRDRNINTIPDVVVPTSLNPHPPTLFDFATKDILESNQSLINSPSSNSKIDNINTTISDYNKSRVAHLIDERELYEENEFLIAGKIKARLKPNVILEREAIRLSIMDMMFKEYSLKEISTLLQVDEEKLYSLVFSKQFQLELKQWREEIINRVKDNVTSKLANLAPEAVDKVATLMRTAHNERVRLDASKDILDRGGHSKTDIAKPFIQLQIIGLDSSRLGALLGGGYENQEKLANSISIESVESASSKAD